MVVEASGMTRILMMQIDSEGVEVRYDTMAYERLLLLAKSPSDGTSLT